MSSKVGSGGDKHLFRICQMLVSDVTPTSRHETYPSMLINLRSPPKYLAYKRDIGRPYPNPAMGALKSLLSKSGSRLGVLSTVVYMYVQTRGMALRGIPPP